MDHVRDPARRGLNEAETELGKLLRYAIGHEIAEGDHGQDAVVRKRVVAFKVEQLHEVAAAGSGVDANREVETLSGGVDWKKIWIIQGQIAFHAAKETSDGSLRLCPFHFLPRHSDVSQRQDRDPLEPIRRRGALLRNEAVIGAA